MGSPDDITGEVSPRTRRLVHLFLVVLAITGFAHLELYPFTGFRLFSEVRPAERESWQLRAVTESGEELAIRTSLLPIAYRNSTRLLAEFPGLGDEERDAICDAWARPFRDDGRAIVDVRVYAVVESVRPDGPEPTRSLAYECGTEP